MSSLKKWGRGLLRGPAQRLWLDWKTRKLCDAYGRLLLSKGQDPIPVPKPKAAHAPLRNLLFVYDRMWEDRELFPELQRLCDVTAIDVKPHKVAAAAPADERLKIDSLEKDLMTLKGKSFDAIIVYLNSALLEKELTSLLRNLWSCPLIGLNLDDKTTFPNYEIFRSHATNYEACAGWFDANLTNSKAMVDVYHQAGFPCLYLPTGFHYDAARMPAPDSKEWKYRLSFVGSRKPERAMFVEALQKIGFEVDIFGQGWPNGKFVENGWQIFRQSQINLGIGYHTAGPEMTNLKNRDFECPGAGGCYLTTFDWELAELFHVGAEILCYRNAEEFYELYSYYVRRPERCLEIARAGQARAIREHTWAHRFAAIFRELGFSVGELA